MGGIVDTIVIILFVAILAMFVIGFNRQMLDKHKDRLKEKEEYKKNKDNKSKDDIND